MQDLAVQEPHNPTELPALSHQQLTALDPGLARLEAWAATAMRITRMSEILCKASFTPKHFRDKPAEVFAAIMAGHEMGIQPVASLQAFFVINGAASPYARTLHSVALKLGHVVEIVEETATKVSGRARRKDSTHWEEVTWTMERAQQAGLTKNAVYKAYPQAMLRARVITDLIRRTCPEVTLGLVTVEEAQTGPLASGDVPPPPQSSEPSTTVKRRTKTPPPQQQAQAEQQALTN